MHIFENGMRGSKMWRMYIVCTGSFLPILVGIGPTPIPSLVVIHQKPNPWAEIDGCCSTISLAIKIMIILCHFFQRREECGWSIKHLSCNDQVSLWIPPQHPCHKNMIFRYVWEEGEGDRGGDRDSFPLPSSAPKSEYYSWKIVPSWKIYSLFVHYWQILIKTILHSTVFP